MSRVINFSEIILSCSVLFVLFYFVLSNYKECDSIILIPNAHYVLSWRKLILALLGEITELIHNLEIIGIFNEVYDNFSFILLKIVCIIKLEYVLIASLLV